MRVKHKDTKKEHLNMSMTLSQYLDEYLMPINKKNHSFLNKLKIPSKTNRKATPKKKDEISKLSKIFSTLSNNKLLVGIIIAIIVALLNTNRIKNWINTIVDNF